MEFRRYRLSEQLSFELERSLFGRQQNQRRTLHAFPQDSTDFGQAAECLAAAGGAKQKARLHTGFFVQIRPAAKQFI